MKELENTLFDSLQTEEVQDQDCNKATDYFPGMLKQRQRPPVEEIEKQKLVVMETNEKTAGEELPHQDLKPYVYEDVLREATAYFKGDTMAANVWINKYALKNSSNQLFELTPDDMHRRLASEIARVESKYPNPLSKDEIRIVIKQLTIFPGC